MDKEGLETYDDLIKIFILVFYTFIRQDKEILLDYNYMYITMQSNKVIPNESYEHFLVMNDL